ncbi:MAG: class I SAM-dependent methyltransferase [Chitinophagales bacterium]
MSQNNPTDPWTERWNERYSDAVFAYGELPNEFLKEQLQKLTPGSILFPAEGEGRNAVFAATLGWKTTAFDISSAGRNKAQLLAQKNDVTIQYLVGELDDLHFQNAPFDAIALIYAHFPAPVKSQIHKKLDTLLRVGGCIIFEAFSKKHLQYQSKNEKVGGPKDIESLFSLEEIQADFPNYKIIQLEECEIELQEGRYHNGTGSVIRFVGMKLKQQ